MTVTVCSSSSSCCCFCCCCWDDEDIKGRRRRRQTTTTATTILTTPTTFSTTSTDRTVPFGRGEARKPLVPRPGQEEARKPLVSRPGREEARKPLVSQPKGTAPSLLWGLPGVLISCLDNPPLKVIHVRTKKGYKPTKRQAGSCLGRASPLVKISPFCKSVGQCTTSMSGA
jgi:hypothetical protein